MADVRTSLRLFLAVAVPMWADRLSGQSPEALAWRCEQAGIQLAHCGDRFVRQGGPRRGEPGQHFNNLAAGLAAMTLLIRSGNDAEQAKVAEADLWNWVRTLPENNG